HPWAISFSLAVMRVETTSGGVVGRADNPLYTIVESFALFIPEIESLARQGAVLLLIFDLDNLLMRPKAYLGSEFQEWDSTDMLMRTRGWDRPTARKRVLQRRDIDEARMVLHKFYEPAAGLTSDHLKTLSDIAVRHQVGKLAATARPGVVEEIT